VKPQESPAIFPTVDPPQPLLQRAFQEITCPNLPTRLGEDPKKFSLYLSHALIYSNKVHKFELQERASK